MLGINVSPEVAMIEIGFLMRYFATLFGLYKVVMHQEKKKAAEYIQKFKKIHC